MKTILLSKSKHPVGWSSIPRSMLPKVLNRIGHDKDQTAKFLASGSKGSIYSLSTGDILKITEDAGEARASLIVKDRPDKNVYTVFDSFEIGNDGNLFGIVMEDLDDPDPQWVVFGDIFNRWHSAMTDYFKNSKNKHRTPLYVLPPLVEVFSTYVERRYKTGQFSEQIEWLREISEYLQETEILFLDIHGGNIMKSPRTGGHVLIDLGYSETPPVELDRVTAMIALSAAKKVIIAAEILLNKKH